MKLDDFDKSTSSHSGQGPVEELYQQSLRDQLVDTVGYSKHILMLEAITEAALGSEPPGPTLIKAKSDKSWIQYFDKQQKPRYMQVHNVLSIRDVYHSWAVYGVDEQQLPLRIAYDLRPGRESSKAFDGIRELQFPEVIQLVKAGVIKGEGGAPISDLKSLMDIADEPWRNLLMTKSREAAASGISLSAIEKQIFAEPSASSAQRRN